MRLKRILFIHLFRLEKYRYTASILESQKYESFLLLVLRNRRINRVVSVMFVASRCLFFWCVIYTSTVQIGNQVMRLQMTQQGSENLGNRRTEGALALLVPF
jgi:hypothetical protein